jgi:hypothetical protein
MPRGRPRLTPEERAQRELSKNQPKSEAPEPQEEIVSSLPEPVVFERVDVPTPKTEEKPKPKLETIEPKKEIIAKKRLIAARCTICRCRYNRKLVGNKIKCKNCSRETILEAMFEK